MAERLKRASVRVSGALAATPLPSSPLIKVTAQATTAAGATALANAGASALQAYVNHQVRATDVTASLTQRYQQAALAYRRKKDTSDRLERRYRLHPTKRNRSARDAAGAATDGAQLAAQALQSSYQQAVAGGTASAVVESFSRAGPATSDRKQTMQILVFVGLLGGDRRRASRWHCWAPIARRARVGRGDRARLGRRDRRGCRRRGLPGRAHPPRARRGGRARRRAVPAGRRAC